MDWSQRDDGVWEAYSQKTHWHWELVPYKPDQYPDSWLLKGRHWTWDDEWRWFGAYQGLENAQSSAKRENGRDSSHPLFRLRRPSLNDDEED